MSHVEIGSIGICKKQGKYYLAKIIKTAKGSNLLKKYQVFMLQSKQTVIINGDQIYQYNEKNKDKLLNLEQEQSQKIQKKSEKKSQKNSKKNKYEQKKQRSRSKEKSKLKIQKKKYNKKKKNHKSKSQYLQYPYPQQDEDQEQQQQQQQYKIKQKTQTQTLIIKRPQQQQLNDLKSQEQQDQIPMTPSPLQNQQKNSNNIILNQPSQTKHFSNVQVQTVAKPIYSRNQLLLFLNPTTPQQLSQYYQILSSPFDSNVLKNSCQRKKQIPLFLKDKFLDIIIRLGRNKYNENSQKQYNAIQKQIGDLIEILEQTQFQALDQCFNKLSNLTSTLVTILSQISKYDWTRKIQQLKNIMSSILNRIMASLKDISYYENLQKILHGNNG